MLEGWEREVRERAEEGMSEWVEMEWSWPGTSAGMGDSTRLTPSSLSGRGKDVLEEDMPG